MFWTATRSVPISSGGARPPKGERAQAARIYLRADETEKRSYEKAAEIDGLDLSEWVRARLNAAASREINRA